MKFDDARKLNQKKYRTLHRHFLVEGEHLLQELEKAALTQPRLKQSTVFVTERFAGVATSLPVQVISEKQMKQISGTQTPQGIIAAVPFPEKRPPQAGEKAIYLYEVQDPGNLGTIIRTLVWFGGFRLLLSPNSVDPYNDKVVRSSMGAIFHVPLETEVDLATLPERFPRTACLDMQGQPLSSGGFDGYDCFLFGNEARGVPGDALQAAGAEAWTIPGSGLIESLNLASAVNLSVWEIKR